MQLPREVLENPSRFYSTIIIGAPKEGKTESYATYYDWLVETQAESKKVWLFDHDEGGESLIRAMRDRKAIKDLEVFRYNRKAGEKISALSTPNRSDEEFLEFRAEFNKLFDMRNPATGKWKDPANSPGLVLIDGITAIKDLIYDFVLVKQSKEIGGSGGSGITFDEQAMFKAKARELINGLKGLPCHVGMTAHVEIRQEVSRSGANKIEAVATGNSYVVPIIFGDLRWMLTSLFDIVLYTQMPGFKWITTGNARIKGAGVRTAKGLPAIMDQDFRKILGAGVIKKTPEQIKMEQINSKAVAPMNTSPV